MTLLCSKPVVLLFAALGKADPLISTAARQKFDLDLWPWPVTFDPWPWPRPLTLTLKQGNRDVKTQFLAFDLDLWPTTLTYNQNLAKVNVNLHTEYRGGRSNGLDVRGGTYKQSDIQTDGRMDGWTDTTKYIISTLCGR